MLAAVMVKAHVLPAWSDLKVQHGKVGVAGGYNRQHLATDTRKCRINTTELRFLKVAAKEPWLIAGASGNKKLTPGLSARMTLVEDLKKALVRACDGRPTSATTVLRQGTDQANGTSQADADEMDELSCDDEPTDNEESKNIPGTRAERHRRNRYFRNHCKGRVLKIQMREKAPETHPTCTTTIPVRLYCENRRTVWLCTEEAQWAMEYLRDQLEAKIVRATATNKNRRPGEPPPPLENHLAIGDMEQNSVEA